MSIRLKYLKYQMLKISKQNDRLRQNMKIEGSNIERTDVYNFKRNCIVVYLEVKEFHRNKKIGAYTTKCYIIQLSKWKEDKEQLFQMLNVQKCNTIYISESYIYQWTRGEEEITSRNAM